MEKTEVPMFLNWHNADNTLRAWAEQCHTLEDVWNNCKRGSHQLWLLDKADMRTRTVTLSMCFAFANRVRSLHEAGGLNASLSRSFLTAWETPPPYITARILATAATAARIAAVSGEALTASDVDSAAPELIAALQATIAMTLSMEMAASSLIHDPLGKAMLVAEAACNAVFASNGEKNAQAERHWQALQIRHAVSNPWRQP